MKGLFKALACLAAVAAVLIALVTALQACLERHEMWVEE